MRGNHLIAAIVLGALVLPGVAPAADCGAPGKAKIFDRLATTGKARIIYRSGKVPCVDKGPLGTLADLSGSFDLAYIDGASVRGAFVMPSPWYLHKDNKAKYLNRDAPTGGGVKIAGFKQAQNVRVSARTMGDGPALDILSGPPGPSGVLAIATLNNAAGGTSTRVCTRWSVADGSILNYQPEIPGVSAKLLLAGGVPSACNVAPIPTTTTTSTTSTTSTSTSVTTSTSTSVTTTTSTSSTTTTTLQLRFVTAASAAVCGEARQGGAAGTIIKPLTCGGLNIGGGCSQEGGSCGVNEGPTPAGAATIFKAACAGPTCTITALTAGQTGSNNNCTNTGCQFGTWLSIANGGTSTCVLNTFQNPASGTLDLTTGAFNGSIPLTSAVTLTGNGAAPCPACLVGGSPGQGAGVCSGAAVNSGAVCAGLNPSGDNYECLPNGVPLSPFGVDLTPITTGVTFMDTTTDMDQVPGGLVGQFCPGQDATEPGSLGCFATSKGGPAGPNPLCDYIEERGSPAVGITVGGPAVAATLGSVFCIPAAGNGLIDGAADLPGPGATTLPGTLRIQ